MRLEKGIVADRIIPARAGFTSFPRMDAHYGEDHPRSRGVYIEYERPTEINDGSSPLARGLQMYALYSKPRPGIIPARAGFTTVRTHVCHTSRDHPRSRGVY